MAKTWRNSDGQPPREAVSWNGLSLDCPQSMNCQPPREAVSWNKILSSSSTWVETSASSWGCELKCRSPGYSTGPFQSASSWGCELKYICGGYTIYKTPSASSWGCELKWTWNSQKIIKALSASSWGCELECTWVRIPVWGQASCEVAYSTRYNKDSPTSIGGEMNCKQENERQWRAERNRYPPLTWGKSQSACCWHVRLCEITDCELKQILL